MTDARNGSLNSCDYRKLSNALDGAFNNSQQFSTMKDRLLCLDLALIWVIAGTIDYYWQP